MFGMLMSLAWEPWRQLPCVSAIARRPLNRALELDPLSYLGSDTPE